MCSENNTSFSTLPDRPVNTKESVLERAKKVANANRQERAIEMLTHAGLVESVSDVGLKEEAPEDEIHTPSKRQAIAESKQKKKGRRKGKRKKNKRRSHNTKKNTR